MPQGYLVVSVSSAKGRIIISNATIRVTNKSGFEYITKTNVLGKSEEIPLSTPTIEEEYSENCIANNCSMYVVEVSAEGFDKGVFSNIQIMADTKSYLNAYLVPINGVRDDSMSVVTLVDDAGNTLEEVSPTQIFNEVYIPNTITVHLGRPDSDARNVTVPFTDYVKNVACSEIYPTWPYEAIRANVLAIISLALNRVYTSWYKVRGYNFQITNSTQFDQKFIENRNIFESISNVVDETFNEYIRYIGNIEPLFSSYCDGKIAQCDGMTQWGSYDLAREGNNAIEILKYYYGNNIEVVTTNNIQDIHDPFPGIALKIGDSSSNVYLMQTCLNRISIDYPNIPRIYPANGIFTRRMEQSVLAFQEQFNLVADGIIGKATWYKILYIYLSVKKLAQLGSEGERLPEQDLEYPKTPLREGSLGFKVQVLQYLLNTISLFYEGIVGDFIDGRFGNGTKNTVISFQREFGLPTDGIVGEVTWNKIVDVFLTVNGIIPAIDEVLPYPGFILKEGVDSEYTVFLQMYLNEISEYYPSIPTVKVDGVFGPATTNQVKAFQKEFGLPIDGIVGRETWDQIIYTYSQLYQVVFYPNMPLSIGDTGNYVKLIQIYLNAISNIYNEIPEISVDGVFGQQTLNAVLAFQELFGLPIDGVVGKQTWNKILEVYLNDVKELGIDGDFDSLLGYLNDRESNSVQYTIKDRTGKA